MATVKPKAVAELPKIDKTGGRTRDYNPFDEYVEASRTTGQAYQYSYDQLAKLDIPDAETARKKLSNSAAYFGYGVDIRVTDESVTFRARDRRQVATGADRKPRNS